MNNLKLYIFDPNFFQDIISSMSSSQYVVVVQHPMYNGVFDADLIKEQNRNY